RTLPRSCSTRVWRAIRHPMKVAVPMPRIKSPTTMATTIRITLTALLCAGVAGVEATAAAGTAAPHLGQNFAPGSTVAPHALQNAMSHLWPELGLALNAEYIVISLGLDDAVHGKI